MQNKNIRVDESGFSVRTTNLCLSNNLNTTTDILEFYKSKNSFMELRHCGIKINEELVAFCKSIIEEEPVMIADESAADYMNIMAKKLQLSVRATNVCINNGLITLKDIIEYYKNNKSFLSFRNSGKGVNDELTLLCQSYLPKPVEDENNETISVGEPSIIAKQLDYLLCIDVNKYPKTKKFLEFKTVLRSLRLKTLISNLFLKNNNNLHEVLNEIHSILFSPAGSFRNIGKSTLSELEMIISDTYNFVLFYESFRNNNDNFDAESFKQFLDCIDSRYSDLFDSYFLSFNNNDFKAFHFFDYVIKNFIFEEREFLIFSNTHSIYHEKQFETYLAIGEYYGLSRERIRQLSGETLAVLKEHLSFFSLFFNDIIRNTTYAIETGYDFLIFNNYFVNRINKSEGNNFSLNYYSLLLQNLFSDSFVRLFEYENTKNLYLIKNEYHKLFDFDLFFGDIFARSRKIVKDYSMPFDELINKYIINNHKNFINKIRDLLIHFLSVEFNHIIENDIITFLRTSAKRLEDYISEALENNEKYIYASDMVSILETKYPEFFWNNNSIKSSVINSKDLIIFGKITRYGLQKWNNFEGPYLKDMIASILKEEALPLNILDLALRLKMPENTSENQIIDYLKQYSDDTFVIFNFGFIGLKDLKYNQSDIDFKLVTENDIQVIKDFVMYNFINRNYYVVVHNISRKFNLPMSQAQIIMKIFMKDKIFAVNGKYFIILPEKKD
ncbi:MAG: hypothetical protein QG635_2044 [Bacteroidota bacterium]|nr:hypothetical protein [Bacteroidota bacterium]